MKHRILLLFISLLNFSIVLHLQGEIIEKEVLALTSIQTPSFEIRFEYNPNGWVISETKEAYDNEYLSYKFEYEYDSNGNIFQLIKYDINYTQKEENKYNDNNQIIEKKVYMDYGGGFKFIEQYFFTYQNRLLETIFKQIISSQGEGINSGKQDFTYNDEQQLVQIDRYDWVMGNWIHTEFFNFKYNDFGDILSYSSEILMWETFEKCWRYVFNYNDGQLVERAYHAALGTEWSPRPLNRYLFYYEEIEWDATILFPNVYQFDELNRYWFAANKKLVKYDYWLADCSSTLYFVESANYFYRPITINMRVENYLKDEVMVFPNPTTGELVVSSEYRVQSIEIFDVYGRKRSQYSILNTQYSNQIDISHLTAGVYLIKIETNNGIITKKIVKQ